MTNKNNTTILNTEAPKTVWELEHGNTCWNVFISGDYFKVIPATFNENAKVLRMLGLVHLTQERADLHARVLNIGLAIKKWKRENDDVEFDWNNRQQKKYHLIYDDVKEEIIFDYWVTLNINTTYFSSQNKVKKFINDMGKNRVIEWLKWKDNDK